MDHQELVLVDDSKPTISNFEPNSILRGAQLTLVGAHRALQNPELFTTKHYQQAAYAVLAGIGIRLLITIPVYYRGQAHIMDHIINWLNFTGDYVLQVPFFLMTIMRYFVPTLDNIFMQSLNWVDKTYVRKHEHEDPRDLRDLYYPQLESYHQDKDKDVSARGRQPFTKFIMKYMQRAFLSMTIFGLSYVPMVGKLILPATSFYTFYRAVGLGPAAIIFSVGLVLPRDYLVMFLQSYYSSRSLMRELLEPYFARVPFTKQEKRNWFRNREGVLFGFALGFYVLIRVPLFGVLVYGIAEASTAYLITKITDPPPPAPQMKQYAASQQDWHNKHEFLSLNLAKIDSIRRKPFTAQDEKK